jgi:hypothetical protein
LLFVTAILGAGRGRGFLAGGIALVAFMGAVAFGAQQLPVLKLKQTFDENPLSWVSKRLEVADQLGRLYADEPRFILTGTGPGTYSSRGWRTFAQSDSRSVSNVAGSYALALTGGEVYRTDVSERYVLPLYRTTEVVAGSQALGSPFSSYTSIAAEVGVLGMIIVLAIYLGALVDASRRALRALRRAVPGDPVPPLLLVAATGMLTLIQMGALDNWLEVTRLTFFSWGLLAIATKELNARE